jgi:ribonucleotide reductase beta subunit family protein with ferritin-like domain
MALAERIARLDSLAAELTIHEAAALMAKVAEKRQTNKLTRFGLYPVTNVRAFLHMKKLEVSHWPADEIKFSKDVNDFNDFTTDEQRPLLYSFGFFAVGDGQVANQIAFRMIVTADDFNQQAFYITQMNNERVHAEVYGKMIHELVKSRKKRAEIFNYVENCQSIKAMSNFIDSGMTFPDGRKQELITLAMAEFLMFTPLFCIIFWYRAFKPGKILNIILANYQVAKDEGTHCLQGCESYKYLPADQKYSQDEIITHVSGCVRLVKAFAEEVLEPTNLVGLTVEGVQQYIEHVADSILIECGHEPYYNVLCPFEWMAFLELNEKSNFYEQDVVKYDRFNLEDSIKEAIRLSNAQSDDEDNNSDEEDENTIQVTASVDDDSEEEFLF